MRWIGMILAIFLAIFSTCLSSMAAPPDDDDSKFCSGRPSKLDIADAGEFDPKDWSARNLSQSSKLETFNRFLQQYDVIGMKKEVLIGLLGEGHLGTGGLRQLTMHTEAGTVAYCVDNRGCVPNSYLRVKFHFSEGKVDRWNFFNAENAGNEDNDSPPITTNVVVTSSQLSQGSNHNWPRTIPK